MGLSYLHRQRRIIHRGLHPGNILIDSTGRYYFVLLFGCFLALISRLRVALSDFTSSSILEKTFAQACTYVGREAWMRYAPHLALAWRCLTISLVFALNSLHSVPSALQPRPTVFRPTFGASAKLCVLSAHPHSLIQGVSACWSVVCSWGATRSLRRMSREGLTLDPRCFPCQF